MIRAITAAVLLSAAAAAVHTAQAQQGGEVVRRIDDPGAHGTWLLVRDPEHPAGPGRFLWVARAGRPSDASAVLPVQAVKPVILAGDRLVVEEQTPVVDARLAATALNPAVAGEPLRVRLEIGGRIMRAIAIAPGRAQLAPDLSIAVETDQP